MYNLLYNTVPESGKNNPVNIDLGTLWKYGKLNAVSTAYLGFVIIALLFTISLELFGKELRYIEPKHISAMWWVILYMLPLVVIYSGFLEYTKEKTNKDSQQKNTTTNNRKKRGK